MANPIYARLQATAQRLITKYGQSATVKRITPPDPVYGGEAVVTSYPATLVPMAYEARYIDGTVIQTGICKFISPRAASRASRRWATASRRWSSSCRQGCQDEF